ncbi:MAG: transposase [Chitinophagaceae bacterium]
MKKHQIFVGIDVSKSKFDYCIVTDISSQKHEFGVAANNQKAIRKFISGLRKKCKDASGILFCMENTGVYSMPLCYELQSAGADYWVASGLEIKRSRGIIRGKSDKTDALCIAMYSVSHFTPLKIE